MSRNPVSSSLVRNPVAEGVISQLHHRKLTVAAMSKALKGGDCLWDSQSMSEIGEDRIREQLGRILSSKEFENSERLCRFLRFSVEALLHGEQDQVKEYLIGKMVFDRNADYDPRLDPIVRVEARRLRKKLEDYYNGAGALEVVRIQLPKGSYVPEIQVVEAAPTGAVVPESAPVKRLAWKGIVVALAGLGLIGILAFAIFQRTPVAVAERSLAVMPARWLWPNEDFPAIRHDEDLAERITASLANRHHAPVISWPSIQRFKGKSIDTREIAKELKISRILIVAVRVEADGLRVTTYLIDAKLDRKLKVSDKRSLALETPADREKAAAAIAADFAAVRLETHN